MAKGVKFTPQTDMAAKVIFVVYFFYSVMYLPIVQALVSIAVGGIAFGYSNSYEIAIVASLVMNFLFPIFAKLASRGSGKEGFTSGTTQDTPSVISARLRGLMGVGSPMSEGFEDAKTTDLSLKADKADKKDDKDTVATKESKPGHVDTDTTDSSGNKVKAEHFESQEQPGLFKLGVIPKDLKSGFHIDTGTTVMNALNSLKPDQMKAMTEDTKNLIETQKSLMSMLQTMKPMMSEGKQMMDTFQEMFGQQGMPAV
jgi:hypothetical protein